MTGVVTIKRAQVKVIDKVELAAAREGILKYVEPREGDMVQADQIVAGLKDEVARAEYDTAKAQAENDIEVRYAKKAYEFAKIDLKKSQTANSQIRGAVSDIDIEEKILAAGKAELQIEQAKWQFDVNQRKADAAQAVLEEFSVVAPFDGMVTAVKKSKGEAVRAGDVIMEITSTRRLKVEGYAALQRCLAGQTGHAGHRQARRRRGNSAGEAEPFQGRIKYRRIRSRRSPKR